MIYTYGFSMCGKSHERHNDICQDSHFFEKVSDRIAIGAVADGLGSEIHSDMASKVAAKSSVLYCQKKISDDTPNDIVTEIIKEAFNHAKSAIEKIADENNYEYDQCDTTLSLAVLKNSYLFYGNSGDSGIIAYTTDGKFTQITNQQRDENGLVFPLYFGESKWIFGQTEGNIASVLLATDGMLEIITPFILQDSDNTIHVRLAAYFMEHNALGISLSENAEESFSAAVSNREQYINNIPADTVDDDKTILVMADNSVKVVLQPDEYYAEPNWEELNKRHNEFFFKKAYTSQIGNRNET
ncbi:hypothetical protein FACS1894133_4330 [Clostridia bacterium]|nr:hypothetical protein FACS1894133_4330 [Clostridia bacterium]